MIPRCHWRYSDHAMPADLARRRERESLQALRLFVVFMAALIIAQLLQGSSL